MNSVAICAALKRTVRKRWGGFDEVGSLVLVWVVLAVTTSILASGASYLFVWPALGGAIALLWISAHRIDRGRFHLVPLVLVAAPALVLLAPAFDTFFQLALPRPGNPDSEVVETIAVVIFLAVLVVSLIAAVAKRDRYRSSKTVITPE